MLQEARPLGQLRELSQKTNFRLVPFKSRNLTLSRSAAMSETGVNFLSTGFDRPGYNLTIVACGNKAYVLENRFDTARVTEITNEGIDRYGINFSISQHSNDENIVVTLAPRTGVDLISENDHQVNLPLSRGQKTALRKELPSGWSLMLSQESPIAIMPPTPSSVPLSRTVDTEMRFTCSLANQETYRVRGKNYEYEYSIFMQDNQIHILDGFSGDKIAQLNVGRNEQKLLEPRNLSIQVGSNGEITINNGTGSAVVVEQLIAPHYSTVVETLD